MSVQTPTKTTVKIVPSDLQSTVWRIDTTDGAPQIALNTQSSHSRPRTPLSAARKTSFSVSGLYSNSSPPLLRRSERSEMTSTPLRDVPDRSRRLNTHSSNNHLDSPTSSPTPSDTAAGGFAKALSPWSTAVGRASTGKTGRVIEKLMADIDKLRREIKAEVVLRQEIERREEALSRLLTSLREENDTMAHSMNMDGSCLRRRDDKIDELRAELVAERARREQAEERAKAACVERDRGFEEQAKRMVEAREMQKQAQRQCDVLEQGHGQLKDEYGKRVEVLVRDFELVRVEWKAERKRVKRLDVVVEQMGQELDRSRDTNRKMDEAMETYKKESEARIVTLHDQARAAQSSELACREEAAKIVEEAQCLIAAITAVNGES